MTIEDKTQEMTKRVKQKLDNINYRITDIYSRISESKLLRDLSRQDVIVTRFTEATLFETIFIITDLETLEMLYVQTGPTNFVDIEEFFKPR